MLAQARKIIARYCCFAVAMSSSISSDNALVPVSHLVCSCSLRKLGSSPTHVLNQVGAFVELVQVVTVVGDVPVLSDQVDLLLP